MKLQYNTPRTNWINGLPIGNGILAAMVWGTEKQDILSFNTNGYGQVKQ